MQDHLFRYPVKKLFILLLSLCICFYSLAQTLPVVSFYQDTMAADFSAHLFGCGAPYPSDCGSYRIINTSTGADSIRWQVRGIYVYNCPFPPLSYRSDTITLVPHLLGFCWGYNIEVCLTAFNQYGSSTRCDSSCHIMDICDEIKEIPLAGISIYPKPADKIVTIDMRQNSDPVTATYTAIIIYNSFGQRIRSIASNSGNRLVELSVVDMPDGIYLATIIDANGAERMLGRFVVKR